MAMKFNTEKSTTSGKSYEPSGVGVNKKNGLYNAHTYDPIVDPFKKKQTTNKLGDPVDPFNQKVGYEPTTTADDLANRKIREYEGHKYETYYDYGFPNDKKREKKKEEPKQKVETEPNKVKKDPVKENPKERPETPLPYNAAKSISRTLQIMTKGNRVYPSKSYGMTDDFD